MTSWAASVSDDDISVRVRDGFIKSFAAEFLDQFGENSLFARTVSDLWTSALARMLVEKGQLSDSDPVALLSDDEALQILRPLASDEALKEPLLQEPLGYSEVGTIKSAFDSAFGSGAFDKWLSAFEQREFENCSRLSQRLS